MKTGELKIGDSQIVIYQAPDGITSLDVRVEEDTVWLTQKQIAELFGTEIPAISKHIRNMVLSVVNLINKNN
ncbi:MAG: hypothetical protein LBV57_03860 [Candidatus Symbiothrix sp.]|jgi:hypothetical protein|nr:hypothetical protein [Candidatus Symbiothrix sp.]